MARKNKLGTPFLGLALEKPEEKEIKAYLKKEGISAKQLMRYLLRKFLKEGK